MLARRIIAVSPDKAFGRQMATALKAAGGAVDLHLTIDELGKGELQAALVVLHLDGDAATAAAEILPRLTGDAKVVAILPRVNLAAVVDTMQSSERVAALMVAEAFDPRELASIATRVLSGDIFGLEKMIRWGTLVHSQLVGDYQEKSLCISQISDFAEAMGVRRKYREAIEQCIDEMLMNALYDAPVDDQGQPVFSEIPTKTRISLRVEQKVVVQYACDGKQFAVSVRDAFGTLERATVLRYLHKCLHAEQQIDRKAGGAGLGLYLMVNSSSTVLFNVLPGVATEVVCVFDLETPKLQLEQLGFFHEKIDAGGRLATGPSKLLPGHPVERRRTEAPLVAGSSGIVRVLSLLIVAICVLIGVVAYSRFFGGKKTAAVAFATTPKGATIEIEGRNAGSTTSGTLVVPDLEIGRAYPVVARLDGFEPKQQVVEPRAGGTQVTIELRALAATVKLDTAPNGATVLAGGKPLGTTPLSLATLAPGSTVDLVFRKTGYQDATATLEVPGPGKELRFIQPLAVSDELARVKLLSDPPGAAVTQNGQLLAGVTTPAEVLVEAGKPVRFVMTMPHKVPAMIDAFTPGRGEEGIVKTGKLVDGATVKLEATIEGKVSIAGAPHCQAIATPAECVLAKGDYTIDFAGAFDAHVVHKVAITQERTERFDFGFAEAAAGTSLLVAGHTAKRIALEVGSHQVTVQDEAGTHAVAVRIRSGATATVN